MADDSAIRQQLEARAGWTRQNRNYHVKALSRDIGSQRLALYVRAHQAGVDLGKHGVDDSTLLAVGELSRKYPLSKPLDSGPTTGDRSSENPGRRKVAAVMFLDIAGSTKLGSRLGDTRYETMLSSLNNAADRLLKRHGGRLIKTTGDGFLATFSLPSNAVRCALDLLDLLEGQEVPVRIGIHLAEVTLKGGDVIGLGVNVAQRIEAESEPNQVLVSEAVKASVAGSGIKFRSVGTRQLKGVEGLWELFSVG